MRFFGICGIFLGVLKHSRFGRWFLREPINGWDSFNLLEIMRWSRWRLISRLVLSVTASGKVLTAFYSCLRLNTLLTSEPQTFREGLASVSINYSQRWSGARLLCQLQSLPFFLSKFQHRSEEERKMPMVGGSEERSGRLAIAPWATVAQFLLLTSSWSYSTHTNWVFLYNHLCLCWSNPQMFPPFLMLHLTHALVTPGTLSEQVFAQSWFLNKLWLRS